MPRRAREREKNLPHHIMSRSMEELMLFNCDEDKDHYLLLLKSSAMVYGIEILCYCLMDNHVHLLVHPRGGDISKFMHAINNSYAKYYNRINDRRGHVFSERYKNIVVRDLEQLLRNSTYIHNNAKDLLHQGYNRIEDYPYSSIKDYTQPGMGKGIAKPDYIFSQMSSDRQKAHGNYLTLLEIQSRGEEQFQKEVMEAFDKVAYESDRKKNVRDAAAEQVIEAITDILQIKSTIVRHIKYHKGYRQYKGLLAISLRIYCGMTLNQMTKVFMNHTSSVIGNLAREGLALLEGDKSLTKKIERAIAV